MKIEPDRARLSQTLVHGFRVLQAFTAPQPTLTLGQVADRTGLDTASVFHLVQTLVVLGYIERISGTKQFRLTLKPLELGFHAIAQNPESFFSLRGIDKKSPELNSYSLSELLENGYSLSEPLDKTK
jgi:DNA-binding MarR family transcriptional regulator